MTPLMWVRHLDFQLLAVDQDRLSVVATIADLRDTAEGRIGMWGTGMVDGYRHNGDTKRAWESLEAAMAEVERRHAEANGVSE